MYLLNNAQKDQYTQAIILYSSAGNEYSAIIKNACSKEQTEERALLERLKMADDTEIRYVLCMWQDNAIDITSDAFRKLMIDLDPKNMESLMFVMTAESVGVIKVSATIK